MRIPRSGFFDDTVIATAESAIQVRLRAAYLDPQVETS